MVEFNIIAKRNEACMNFNGPCNIKRFEACSLSAMCPHFFKGLLRQLLYGDPVEALLRNVITRLVVVMALARLISRSGAATLMVARRDLVPGLQVVFCRRLLLVLVLVVRLVLVRSSGPLRGATGTCGAKVDLGLEQPPVPELAPPTAHGQLLGDEHQVVQPVVHADAVLVHHPETGGYATMVALPETCTKMGKKY